MNRQRYQVYIYSDSIDASFQSSHKTLDAALKAATKAERLWMRDHDTCECEIWDSETKRFQMREAS